jgi:hypothetical protein
MKRFLMLVGVAVVAAAMYVAASPASQQSSGPTAKQFNALKKQVASLSKSEKAVKKLAVAEAAVLAACDQLAVPIDQFGDGQNQTEGYVYGQGGTPAAPTPAIFTTGLDVTDPTQDTGALFITGGDSTCSTLVNGSALRHDAAKAGMQLSRASSHLWSFSAHRR